MQQLNLISGKTKEEIAIDFIREHEPPEGYYVGISGGKDSDVLKDIVRRSGVKVSFYYSATGIDPPEVVRHLRDNHPDVVFKRPKMSFLKELQIKGYPCRIARWCCDTLKKNPTADIDLSHRIMGIRAEESRARAARKDNPEYYKGLHIYKPLFYWLEWEIWEYIESHNLPYCSLYDEGFSRIGCVVCPFLCHGIKGNLLKHMERWPKIYVAFEKAMKKLFDNYLCVVNPRSGAMNYRRETDFETFINNWYRGK